MPASRSRRLTAVLDEYLPTPARVLLTLVVLMVGLCVAGSTWPPLPSAVPNAPAAMIVITPDDPAAPTPVPVQSLGR